MFSPDSPFVYSLLNQNEQSADQLNLFFLEKQYLQNIQFLNDQIVRINERIDMSQVINDGYRKFEIELHAKLSKIYKGKLFYNSNQRQLEINRLQEVLRKTELSILHAAKANFELFTSLSEAQEHLDDQAAGLSKIRKKIEFLKSELNCEEEQVCTYQPPHV